MSFIQSDTEKALPLATFVHSLPQAGLQEIPEKQPNDQARVARHENLHCPDRVFGVCSDCGCVCHPPMVRLGQDCCPRCASVTTWRFSVPSWLRVGAPIWYRPHHAASALRYAGVVDSEPILCGLTPCVRLRDMDVDYQRLRDGMRSTVPAAAVANLDPRGDWDCAQSNPLNEETNAAECRSLRNGECVANAESQSATPQASRQSEPVPPGRGWLPRTRGIATRAVLRPGAHTSRSLPNLGAREAQ